MRAANLHDIFELFSLRRDRVAHFPHFGNQLVHLLGGGDMHRGGKCIVRRLRHIHVVIRMNRLLAAQHAAGQLDRAIRNHFIRVHVGLRATARLPHPQRKMLIELALDHFVTRLYDKLQLVAR